MADITSLSDEQLQSLNKKNSTAQSNNKIDDTAPNKASSKPDITKIPDADLMRMNKKTPVMGSSAMNPPPQQSQESSIGLEPPDDFMSYAQGKLPGVDYKTGLSQSVRSRFLGADNDTERRKELEKFYKPTDIIRDPAGNFLVKHNGKFIEVQGNNPLSNFGAEITSKPFTYGLGGIGGTLGEMANPAGGGIPGSMLGAAGGKTLDELLKAHRIGATKTPLQEIKEVGETGLSFGIPEALGKGLKAAGGGIANKVRDWWGITPEIKTMTAQSQRIGATPSIKAIMPEAKVTQFHEALSEKLAGSWTEKKNIEAINNMAKDLLKQAGVSDPEAAMRDIITKDLSEQKAYLGQKIISKTKEHIEHLENEIKVSEGKANKILDAELARINKAVELSPSDVELGRKAGQDIIQAREDFGEIYAEQYKKIEQITGGKPVVNTRAARLQAKQVLDSLPKDRDGNPIFADAEVLRKLKALSNAPDRITISDAQAYRHDLGKLALSGDLTPGVSERQFGLLKESVDRAMDNSMRGDPTAAKAVTLLRTLNKGYSEGIRDFDLGVANKIVSQYRSAIVPNASVITNQIVRKGFREQAATIKKLVSPETWKKVVDQDWKNIVASTSENGVISAKKFYKMITDPKGIYGEGMLETVYGKDNAELLRNYAKKLAQKDSLIPVNEISPNNFEKSLKKATDVQNKLDSFLSDNYLSELAGSRMDRDIAVHYLIEPGRGEKLQKAVDFYGKNSGITKDLQTHALKDVLSQAVTPTASGAGTSISGTGIKQAMSKYSKQQKEILFPNGFDQDMDNLANIVNFLFPKKGSDGMTVAGLTAGTIKAALPFGVVASKSGMPGGNSAATLALSAYGYGIFAGWVLSRPSVVKALVFGLSTGDSTTLKILSNSLDAYAKTVSTSDVPDVGGGKETLPKRQSLIH